MTDDQLSQYLQWFLANQPTHGSVAIYYKEDILRSLAPRSTQ